MKSGGSGQRFADVADHRRRPRAGRVRRRLGVTAAAAVVLAALPLHAEEMPQKTVEECVQIALEHHPTLGAAGATVDAANQRVWQVTSGYLPQVTANYDANRRMTTATAQTGADLGNPGKISQTFNFYQTGLTFNQVLFDFGRTLASIRAAQESQRSAEADYSTQRAVVILGVKQAYYNVLAGRRLLGVADETVRQTNKQLDQARGRFEVGLAPRFDVTRAEVQVAGAELNQVTASNNYDVARVTLVNAMGLNGLLAFDVVDTLEAPQVQLNEKDAVDAAYANRPEIMSLDAQRASQQQRIESLQRDYLPSVGGGGTYYWSGTTYPLEPNWNIGASVTVTLFNGGLTTAQIGEAKALLSNIDYTEQSTKQNIALQVRQALLDVRQASQSIRVSQKGLQSARESLDLAEGRYNTGVGNIIELTDAQASLTSAEASLVQSQANYQISIASLERAVGRGLGAEGESR
jgi:outer membrane protein